MPSETSNNNRKSRRTLRFVGGLAAKVFHNAEGGIYQKGAFLTTFAEEGPEAAIPLDGSQRAVGLWKRAGEILGVGADTPMEDGAGSASAAGGMGMMGVTNRIASSISAPPINIQLTFNGPADAQDVRAAVEDAGQTVQQSFAEQMEAYMSEKDGGTYGIGVQLMLTRYPKNRLQLSVNLDTNKEQAESAVTKIRQCLDRIAQEGPDPVMMQKSLEYQQKTISNYIGTNDYWMQAIMQNIQYNTDDARIHSARCCASKINTYT